MCAASDGVRIVELLDVPYLLEPRIMFWDWVVDVMEREWTMIVDWRRIESRRVWSIMMIMDERICMLCWQNSKYSSFFLSSSAAQN